jgi:hypothetical protein
VEWEEAQTPNPSESAIGDNTLAAPTLRNQVPPQCMHARLAGWSSMNRPAHCTNAPHRHSVAARTPRLLAAIHSPHPCYGLHVSH